MGMRGILSCTGPAATMGLLPGRSQEFRRIRTVSSTSQAEETCIYGIRYPAHESHNERTCENISAAMCGQPSIEVLGRLKTCS